MSSPIHDDRDKRAMYVPPWARDELRDEETRRIHAEIVAAAERLKPPAPAAPPPPKPQRVAPPPVADFPVRGDRPSSISPSSMSKSGPADGPFDVESAMRDAWEPSGLEPVAVQPPPSPKLNVLNWGVVSRLAGAGGFAAIVALFVIGAIPLPSIDISVSRDHKDANAAAPSGAPATGNTRQLAAAPPPVAPKQAAPAAAPQPVAALAPTTGVAANPPSSPFSAPPVAPRVVEPALPPPPKPAAGLPEARVLDYMSREEIDGLVKRGQDLLAIGDISGGRLLLTRAAEAGDARASFALAGTYDSAVVATLGAVGAFPDAVKARSWYMKAAEQGSTEAVRRLEQPHLRQR
jgi:hypothetical protein